MQQQFGNFVASELHCPKCGSAQPVRERLLLVLPSGELHEYLCARCSTSLGEREVTAPARKVAAAAPRPAANGTRRLLRG
jgi:DNA-directed RNA polymerase subunit RPC12/RpoP